MMVIVRKMARRVPQQYRQDACGEAFVALVEVWNRLDRRYSDRRLAGHIFLRVRGAMGDYLRKENRHNENTVWRRARPERNIQS